MRPMFKFFCLAAAVLAGSAATAQETKLAIGISGWTGWWPRPIGWAMRWMCGGCIYLGGKAIS